MSNLNSRLLVANWKSHKTLDEAKHWLRGLIAFLATESNQSDNKLPQIVLAPPYPFLLPLSEQLRGVTGVSLAVQDISPFPAGSYTGAVSVRNLEGLPITHAIVGHSERRRYFHETHQEIANKVDLLIEANITPIVCVDQTYIIAQAEAIPKRARSGCVVAYEPLESIGTGVSQEVAKVLPVVEEIRTHFGQVPVIYGGSVDEDNLDAYLLATNGVLVGGASLEIAEFSDLITKSIF